jgi:hypothetical protein
MARGGDECAVVLLAKFLIARGWAERPSILPVRCPYTGCILMALVVGERLKGPESYRL